MGNSFYFLYPVYVAGTFPWVWKNRGGVREKQVEKNSRKHCIIVVRVCCRCQALALWKKIWDDRAECLTTTFQIQICLRQVGMTTSQLPVSSSMQNPVQSQTFGQLLDDFIHL